MSNENKQLKIESKTLAVGLKTSKGLLKAVVSNDDEYPGILVYLDEELYGAVEFYEEEQALRFRGYNNTEEEPIIITTLQQF